MILLHPTKSVIARAKRYAIDDAFNPQQPRVEAGEHGGEWTRTGHLVLAGDKDQWPPHIKALRVPPAWSNVHIAHNPEATLLVTGYDAKGRKQYVYSKAFSASQAEAKFNRIRELDAKFDTIAEQNDSNRKAASRGGLSGALTIQHAEILDLIMHTGMRPGGDLERGSVPAYGASTLEGRHVFDDGRSVRFVGKKGVNLSIDIADLRLARMLKERAAAAGDNGRLFPDVTPSNLLDYTHSLDGGDFKTKDFRTCIGTRTAQAVIEAMPRPTSKAAYKKAVKIVATAVSKKLGNTPSVALSSYISPFVFAPWRQYAPNV